MNPKIISLHERAMSVSISYRRLEGELIEILQQMEDLKGHREFGFTSLYDYATKKLKLSEDIANTLIRLARKSKEIPLLKEKIQSREIQISNAKAIAPIITPANQTEWLEKASLLSKRELEKEIFAQFPKEEVKERVKPINAARSELRIGISHELEEQLRRVQDLLSQKMGKHATLEETLEKMTQEFLERSDPIKKAERLEQRAKKLNEPSQETRTLPAPGRMNLPEQSEIRRTNRVPIPASLRHQIVLRDRNQCTYLHPQNRERCSQKRWLDTHHIIPVSQGGEDSVENLTTLCQSHHSLIHN